jgi:hypothetical protein
MNREDIIRMAREAGFASPDGSFITWGASDEQLERFAALIAAAEREKLAAWMMRQGYATGHGDTIKDLLKELEWQIKEREREAILDEWCMCVQSDLENGVKSLNERAAEKWHKEYPAISGFHAAIRARSEQCG